MSADFAWGLVDSCAYAFLSMTSEDGTPYGLPITIARSGNQIYFHSAMEGRKVSSLRKHPEVCLTCVGKAEPQEGRFTMRYESAMAFGMVTEVRDPCEKVAALRLLCLRYAPHHMGHFDDAMRESLDATLVFRLDVKKITGKCNK